MAFAGWAGLRGSVSLIMISDFLKFTLLPASEAQRERRGLACMVAAAARGPHGCCRRAGVLRAGAAAAPRRGLGQWVNRGRRAEPHPHK